MERAQAAMDQMDAVNSPSRALHAGCSAKAAVIQHHVNFTDEVLFSCWGPHSGLMHDPMALYSPNCSIAVKSHRNGMALLSRR